MLHKDIIMLVIASRGDRYDRLINQYWSNLIRYIKKHNYNIKIYLLFGNDVETNDLQLQDDDKLILNRSETYIPGILNKTIDAFAIINSLYTYKHLIRTNLSSFFIIDQLIKISNTMNDNNIYNGVIGLYHDRITTFISGACMWLSRDNITYLLEHRANLDNNLIDDVSIGVLLQDKKKCSLERYDIPYTDIEDKKSLLQYIIDHNHYHIRIKTDNTTIDMNYMNAFTEILYSDV
jgi:hypothetical protein